MHVHKGPSNGHSQTAGPAKWQSASATYILVHIWKEELKISLHFLPEGQSFSLYNPCYLKISHKHRAWDSPKSRLCRKESNSLLKRARGAVSLGNCLCCWANPWVCCRSPCHAENLPARAMQVTLTFPVAEGGQIGWVTGWQRCYQNTPWKMSLSWI